MPKSSIPSINYLVVKVMENKVNNGRR